MNWRPMTLAALLLIAISSSENIEETQPFHNLMEIFNKKLGLLEDTISNLKNKIEFLENSHQEARNAKDTGTPKQPPQVLRTCYEYLESDSTLQSDYYFIDPDGINRGDAPFQVYCEMSTGTTMVPHDTENPINVTVPCAAAGCYHRSIVYSATPRQITALKEMSIGCRQYIKYECISAPLQFNNLDYSYWENKKDDKFGYWTGSGGQEHICRCGETNSCIDSAVKCNCDAFSSEYTFDDGYLTGKNHLPVNDLYFGRLGADSVGTHTLGKLECFGKSIVENLPTSCIDVWKLGHSMNGLYTVQNETTKEFKMVYCRMEELWGPDSVEEQVGLVEVYEQVAHFDAVKTTDLNPSPSYPFDINFESLITGSGEYMDIASGIFTAPQPGIYMFSFVAKATDGETPPPPTTVQLEVKKVDGTTFVSSAKTNSGGTLVIHVEQELATGDKVNVKLTEGVLSPGDYHIHFTGSLLHQRANIQKTPTNII